MTAHGQLIVARKPEPSTMLRTVPAGPISAVRPPSAPSIVIDGRRVPVIPPFERADATGLATLVMSSIPSSRIQSPSIAFGLLAMEHSASQAISIDLGAAGSAAAQLATGPGGKVVLNAAFGASGRNAATNAGFGTMAGLSSIVIPNLTVRPRFFGTGSATATVAYPASFAADGISAGDYTQKVYLSEPAAATGSATATVVVKGSAVLSAGGNGVGALSAMSTPKATGMPVGRGDGTLSVVSGVVLEARGAGTLSAKVGVPALFGTVSGATAQVSFSAAGTGVGTLAAPVAVRAAAPFSGAGALIGDRRSAPARGTGALSAITGGGAQFDAVGLPSAQTGHIATLSGMGTLTATATPAFLPSGMTKNGTQTAERTWVTVTGWTANTTTYPGSTVVNNGLRTQGAKTGATLTANIAYTDGSAFGDTQQARLLVNGSVVATGTEQTASSGTLSVTTAANLAIGDIVTVQVITDTPTFATPFSITAGNSTFVRIT